MVGNRRKLTKPLKTEDIFRGKVARKLNAQISRVAINRAEAVAPEISQHLFVCNCTLRSNSNRQTETETSRQASDCYVIGCDDETVAAKKSSSPDERRNKEVFCVRLFLIR